MSIIPSRGRSSIISVGMRRHLSAAREQHDAAQFSFATPTVNSVVVESVS